ncbi:MAG: leucine-rich repeat domain-containing protein, partial [Christensenellaceae bacterium]|nr:leucine-rich repeat domain-containing protein [Christensenellaceae bacterium]
MKPRGLFFVVSAVILSVLFGVMLASCKKDSAGGVTTGIYFYANGGEFSRLDPETNELETSTVFRVLPNAKLDYDVVQDRLWSSNEMDLPDRSFAPVKPGFTFKGWYYLKTPPTDAEIENETATMWYLLNNVWSTTYSEGSEASSYDPECTADIIQSITSLPKNLSFYARYTQSDDSENGNTGNSGNQGVSFGPIYQLSADKNYYIVAGSQYSLDGDGNAQAAVIDATHKGLPVKEIADRAFFNNTTISSIVIPPSITKIGAQAFTGSTRLQTVTLNGANGLTIGDFAFENCLQLELPPLPARTVTVGERAFANVGSARVMGVGMLELVIPFEVSSIGANAYENTRITSVNFDGGVGVSVGRGAFSDCVLLTEAIFPERVTEISMGALFGCSELQIVSITLAKLGETVIYGTPKAVVYFAGTPAMTASLNWDAKWNGADRPIYYEKTYPDYIDENGLQYVVVTGVTDILTVAGGKYDSKIIRVLSEAEVTYLDESGEEVTDVLTVLRIGTKAEQTVAFTSIILPSQVALIEEKAFKSSPVYILSERTSFEGTNFADYTTFADRQVYLYSEVQKDGAYWHYENGVAVRWDEWIASVGVEYVPQRTHGVPSDEDYAVISYAVKGYLASYTPSTSITELVFSASYEGKPVERILANAFEYEVGVKTKTANIKTVKIPASITVIEEAAFKNMPALATVTMLKGLDSVGDEAFFGSAALEEIVLPDGIRTLGNNAFRASGLKSITIPSSLKIIPEGAFRNNLSLESVSFAYTILNGGVEEIKANAFDGTAIKTLVFPVSLKKIGNYAFNASAKLTSIDFVNSAITSIGSSAFAGAVELRAISLPATLADTYDGEILTGTGLGSHAFDGAVNVTSVVVRQNITVIPDYCFAGLEALTELLLPAGLKRIGEGAFKAENGKIAALDLTAHASLKEIGVSAFEGQKALRTLRLPLSLVSIGGDAFKNASVLTDVYLYSASLVGGTGSAFAEEVSTWKAADKGIRLVIMSSVNGIRPNLFEGAQRLTQIEFVRDTVWATGGLAIGAGAFKDCPYLYDVSLPSELLNVMGAEAFKNDIRAVIYFEGDAVNGGELSIESIPYYTNLSSDMILEDSQYTDYAKYVVLNGEAVLTKYTGTRTLYIPTETRAIGSGNYPVTTIGSKAFAYGGLYGFTQAVIPTSVVTVAKNAFIGNNDGS